MRDNIKDIVEKIALQRIGIPQLLFVSSVTYQSCIDLRKKIIDFKKAHNSIEEIDFILQSPGGKADDAYRIIRTLRENFTTVNIVIPFWAKSAATLLSLGGSKIILDEFGEFGPLDAQIGKAREDGPFYERESALNDEHSLNRIETRFKEMYESMYTRIYQSDDINIQKNELSKQLLKHLAQFYEPLMKQINPYKLGEKRRILDIGGQYANRIMAQFKTVPDKETRRIFVDFLVDTCPDHGYVIDYSILKMFLGDIVMKSSEISEDYQNAVTDLSLAFLESEEDDAIEFFYNQPTIIDHPSDPHQSNVKNANNNQQQQSNSTLLDEILNGSPLINKTEKQNNDEEQNNHMPVASPTDGVSPSTTTQ